MSEMIERVALAISGGDDPESILKIHRHRARAAIMAMREPTVQMLVAAYSVVGVPEKPVLANGYRAMIDEALAVPNGE